MAVRLLHLADLHLDSAYGGRPATRSALRAATTEAFERAVAHAIEEGLDAVLIAGDAFDDDKLGLESRSRFRRGVHALARAGVEVVYATGNHDPGGPGHQARRLGLDDVGKASERVHLALDGAPRTFTLRRAGAPSAHVVAAGHVGPRVTDDLAAGLCAPARDGLPRVAVLHTQVGGARGAAEHAPYAPSSLETLARADVDYWALGHVHVRGPVAPGVAAWYPGNLQGRNGRESGPKGGLVVTLDGGGATADVQFVPFAGIEQRTVRVRFLPANVAREPEDLAHAIAGALEREDDIAAPRLVVRAEVGGRIDDTLVRDLTDPTARAALEDVCLTELRARGGNHEPIEIELRVALGDAEPGEDELLEDLLRSPSAAREALELARAIELGSAAADALDLDWSLPGGASSGERRRRVEEVGGALQAEVLRWIREGRSRKR